MLFERDRETFIQIQNPLKNNFKRQYNIAHIGNILGIADQCFCTIQSKTEEVIFTMAREVIEGAVKQSIKI